MTQTFLLAKRPSTAMNEEKRLPFAGYPCLSFYRSRTINHALFNIYLSPGGVGGFWGDHLIFRRTEGGSVVTESPKGGDH